jgi:hypothetical protein
MGGLIEGTGGIKINVPNFYRDKPEFSIFRSEGEKEEEALKGDRLSLKMVALGSFCLLLLLLFLLQGVVEGSICG